jgi:regulator of sigma E protease
MLLKVTPEAKGEGGLIGVTTVWEKVPVALKEAFVESVEYPAIVVHQFVVVMAKIVTGQQKPQLLGPPGIVSETKKAAERGWDYYLQFLGVLSAYLAGFNLVPFPALDGGRLMFLGYEAVTRRRPNARIEAHIHALGLLMLLALIAVVSVFDITGK